jgi:hypothetical protein
LVNNKDQFLEIIVFYLIKNKEGEVVWLKLKNIRDRLAIILEKMSQIDKIGRSILRSTLLADLDILPIEADALNSPLEWFD